MEYKRHYLLEPKGHLPTMTPWQYRWILRKARIKQTQLANRFGYSKHALQYWWQSLYMKPHQVSFMKQMLGDDMFIAHINLYNVHFKEGKIIDL